MQAWLRFSESFVKRPFLEFFISSALLGMSRQLDFGNESLSTIVASKRSFARMRHHVIAQLGLGMGEPLLAVGTRKRRLSLVRPLVAFEERRVREGFAAEFAE